MSQLQFRLYKSCYIQLKKKKKVQINRKITDLCYDYIVPLAQDKKKKMNLKYDFTPARAKEKLIKLTITWNINISGPHMFLFCSINAVHHSGSLLSESKQEAGSGCKLLVPNYCSLTCTQSQTSAGQS